MRSLPLRKILLYYSTVAAMFLTLSGFFSVKEIKNATLQIVFLPVTMYLFLTTTAEVKRILLKKDVQELSFNRTAKKSGYMVFFAVLFFILLTFGIYNLLLNKSIVSPLPEEEPEYQTSQPLIFEGERQIVEIDGSVNTISIKSKPEEDADTIGEINKIEQFEVIEELSGWYKIDLGDKEGYIRQSEAALIEK